jgi:phage virion morphogenesis protein
MAIEAQKDIQLQLFGEEKLQFKFNRLASKIENRRPLMKRIGVVLEQEVATNFKNQAFESKPWEPLAPSTLDARRTGRGASESEGRILQDTGLLRESIAFQSDNDTVRIGTPVEYAPRHQFGIGVPERKFITSKERGLKIAVDVTEEYIEESIKGSGL